MEKKRILEDLQRKFPDSILSMKEQFGDDIIPYAFTMLLDLTCVDYIGEQERYEMVYLLFSLSHKLRLRIKSRLSEGDLNIDSLTSMFKNANWLEREAYDMFGIDFRGHPYLRRLFMYDGFEGYPLRKDYPLRKQQPKIRLRH
jgi:NADH-quinone oxidoreductase subunit C